MLQCYSTSQKKATRHVHSLRWPLYNQYEIAFILFLVQAHGDCSCV